MLYRFDTGSSALDGAKIYLSQMDIDAYRSIRARERERRERKLEESSSQKNYGAKPNFL